MDSSPSDFNEAENFEEYNPHPYQGGYDIALTYGSPLPPSSAICYPLSSSAPPSQASELPPSRGVERSDPGVRRGESEQLGRRDAGETALGNGSAGEEWRRGYGGEEFRGPGVETSPGLIGYRPFPTQGFEKSRGGRDLWDQDLLNCAADYLFTYLDSYGEKRDEICHYGNLNYAYERHYPQEPLLIQLNPHESSWYEEPSYPGDYQEEQVYPHSGYEFGYDSGNSEVAPQTEYGGSSWSPTSYHKDYSRQAYPQSEYLYADERHHYEQSTSVQCEQIEHTWSEKSGIFDNFESHVLPQPSEMHTYGSKRYEQHLDEADFIEKSWYQLLNNDELGEVNSYPQFKTHDGCWTTSDEQSYFPFRKFSDYDD